MVDPGLLMQAGDTAAGLIGLVNKIVKAVQNVRRFKKECRQLANEATSVSGILERNKEAVQNLVTMTQLAKCLTECLTFVIECQGWDVFTVCMEVVFRHRFPRLKQELKNGISRLQTEISVNLYIYYRSFS